MRATLWSQGGGWQVARSPGRSLGWPSAYVPSMTQCQGANVHARRRLWGLWGNLLAPGWQIQKVVFCLGTCPQRACVREWLSVYTAPPSQLDDAGSRARVGLHLRARGPASAPWGSHGLLLVPLLNADSSEGPCWALCPANSESGINYLLFVLCPGTNVCAFF